MTTKAKCPFCKSTDLEYIDSGFLYFYVKCLSCKAQGPGASNEAEAWERWNQAGYYSTADVPTFAYDCAPDESVVTYVTNNASIKPGDRLKLIPDPNDHYQALVDRAELDEPFIGVALQAPQNGHVAVYQLNAMFMMVNIAPGSNIEIGDHLKVVDGPPSEMPLVTTAMADEVFSFIAWSAPKDGRLLAKLI